MKIGAIFKCAGALVLFILASCAIPSASHFKDQEPVKPKSHQSRPIVFQGGEPSATALKIVDFAKKNKGKRVGDGECWGLVNLAYRSAGIRHRGGRAWGRRVHWQKEGVRPGDIIEFEYARYPYAYTDANHTSIILKVVDKDSVLVAHQLWNGVNRVTTTTIPLTYLRSGRQTIYRYGP